MASTPVAADTTGPMAGGGSRFRLDRLGGRAIVHTEGAWRSHLARLAGV